MKASYEKPEITVIDFQVNAAIATCAIEVLNFSSSSDSCKPSDMWKALFPDAENPFDSDACTTLITGYCYYTANDADSSTMLQNS